MDHIEKSTDEGFVMDNQELVTVRKRGSNAIKKHIWNTYSLQTLINKYFRYASSPPGSNYLFTVLFSPAERYLL